MPDWLLILGSFTVLGMLVIVAILGWNKIF